MCSRLHWFSRGQDLSVISLPFDLGELIAGWDALRSSMWRTMPNAFQRDEWAYLISYLSPQRLMAPYREAFGSLTEARERATRLARPLGTVAVWLPNNVSLLGPLMLILLTLTGNRMLFKAGSRSDDLTGAFLDFALAQLPAGSLRDLLENQVSCETFEHGDPRQTRMLEEADVRIVFGSDATAAAIHSAANPLKGVGFSFIDRQSQVWLEPQAASDEVLGNLIRVFAIYGQAGCTSPRRVVLLDGTESQALKLRDRLLAMWPKVHRLYPEVHIASANTLAMQFAVACGWNAAAAPNRQAVVGIGQIDLEAIDSPLFLPLSSATVEEAIAQLPSNIQTVGHALVNPSDGRWLEIVAATGIKRFVPIGRMHHFGSLWDGEQFWARCFEEVELDL